MTQKALCKFRCMSAEKDDEESDVAVVLEPDYSDQGGVAKDEMFSKYTPSGKMEMLISNPNLIDFFVPGSQYLITIEQEE